MNVLTEFMNEIVYILFWAKSSNSVVHFTQCVSVQLSRVFPAQSPHVAGGCHTGPLGSKSWESLLNTCCTLDSSAVGGREWQS